MTEDEYMEVSEDYTVLGQLDIRDTRVKESVVAYLMWHSGEVLDKSLYWDRRTRAEKIDELGREAILRSSDSDAINVDPRRVLAAKSISSQAAAALQENSNSLVCHLDAEMISSGAMIPVWDAEDEEPHFITACPAELGEVGFKFKDFAAFRKKYEDLGRYLVTDPMTVQVMLEHLQGLFLDKSIVNYSQLAAFNTLIPSWNIVGAPVACERTLDSPFSYSAGKLVTIKAQVSEVGKTLPMFTKIAYRCVSRLSDPDSGEKTDRKCNTINLVYQNTESGLKVKPKECQECAGKVFDAIEHSEKSLAVPVQRIQLQEINISEEPKSIMVELRGNLTDQVKAGSLVEITGVVRLQPITKDSLMNHPYILSQSIRVLSEETFTVAVSPEDEEEIKAFAKDTTLEERMEELCAAWNGQLLCDPRIKAALMLQAVGSPSGEFGHRTGIHILIAGDPGTVKTLLLQSVHRAVPGSRYIDTSAATAAGVTAAAEQIEDFYTGKTRWGLRPGIIALTPQEAVCSLDELNLYKGDLGDLHSALESGFITKTTGPVKGTLRADCSILAAANPMDGDQKKFVAGQGIAFNKQLGMSIPMLQRFDLIFVQLDKDDKEVDEAISRSILGHGANRNTTLDISFVQKYISQCKKHNPKLTTKAVDYISKEHARKRSTQKGDYMRSHRMVPSLQRLAIATARFELADEVTIEHVKYAESICELSINESDPGLLTGAQDRETRDKQDTMNALVLKHLNGLPGTAGTLKGSEDAEIKRILKGEDIKFANLHDFKSAMKLIPGVVSAGEGKWRLKEE